MFLKYKKVKARDRDKENCTVTKNCTLEGKHDLPLRSCCYILHMRKGEMQNFIGGWGYFYLVI